MSTLALDLVESTGPDPVTGYRSFTLGRFKLSRDEYFATIEWPAKGQQHVHKIAIDYFLRAMMRDVAWGFFYGWVNFDGVFGTRNLYGSVEMYAGRYNEGYHAAGLSYVETFDEPVIMATFKAILEDWVNAGFDPFAAPSETSDSVFGVKNGSNLEAIERTRLITQRMPGIAGDSPLRTDETGYAINRQFADVDQDEPEVHAEPGFEDQLHAFNLFKYLSRSDVTWNPSVTGVCKQSLACPTTEEFMLPVFHGNDRVEWFIQLSDHIVWDVQDKETGRPRAKITMRAGDVAAMPADIRHQGYSPKRSMLYVWENATPGLPQLYESGKVPPYRSTSKSSMSAIVDRPRGVRVPDKLFIGGRFVDAADGATLAVRNPHDNSVLANVALAGAEDVDRAVAAAKAAFPAWSRLAAGERGRLLLKVADAIEAHADELAELETLNTGHPIRDSRGLDVPRTAATYRYFGGMADKFEGAVIPVEAGFLDYVTYEPIGVVGQIVPWNFPLMFTSWKLGPALAAGNTVVLKPSEITPLTALRVAELLSEAGVPDGVVNVVPGYGNTAGERIVNHPDIGKVSFTGSTAVGKRVLAGSASNLKRVGLELGGKGANIVFDDADVARAVGGSLWAIFHNQGQACIAGSRLILHERIAAEFVEKFVAVAKSIRLGDPLDPQTEMGPLTSTVHRDRVLEYCKVAQDEGGEILTGGKAPPGAAFAGGCYIEPTVVRARATDRVAQEEVFGPFVSVTTFSSDAEAVEIANATPYGLGGGLWTSNLSRAHKTAREIRAGMLWINCYKRVHPGSPFGGMGASGHGREMGFEAMRQYTEPKAVWVNVDAEIPPFYKR